MLPEHRITAGFMPLTDSLLLVVAHEKGFAAAEGVDLTLIRETSWANIRDRIGVGHFDVAHMLAPMPIAAMLGLTPIAAPIIAPFALGLGGNAITVSMALWDRMKAANAPDDLSPGPVGAALAQAIGSTEQKLRFAVVHQHSGHNYELRYWLAASGIDPERQVEIVVLPPPLMADALAAGRIDGYCVGEPWSSVGVASGAGRIATVKALIWPLSPEKVLGVTEGWAADNAEALSALLRALYRAAQWCGVPENHVEAARLLSQPNYLAVSASEISHALSGQIDVGRGTTVGVDDFFVPVAHHATFPAITHAMWFYSQMVRWGDVAHTAGNADLARASVRPDLYRAALHGTVGDLPNADTWPLGPASFFDGKPFDPQDIGGYITSQRPYL
jgi:ABC-type nitrate/sulfonate/bicarbonate transport system substrate-binding protein